MNVWFNLAAIQIAYAIYGLFSFPRYYNRNSNT